MTVSNRATCVSEFVAIRKHAVLDAHHNVPISIDLMIIILHDDTMHAGYSVMDVAELHRLMHAGLNELYQSC